VCYSYVTDNIHMAFTTRDIDITRLVAYTNYIHYNNVSTLVKPATYRTNVLLPLWLISLREVVVKVN